jgi:DNA polymerase elongation subunit (family B)
MKKTQQPRILMFDCETSPVKVWTFRIGNKISIGHDAIVAGQKFDIICICYKWAHESKVHSLTWDSKHNSEKMITAFTKVIESADLVIGHNGDGFDIKQVNTQRLLHNLSPIDWPKSEDTLKMFRSKFYLPSNKLDYISKILFKSGKDKMCFQDWVDIVDGKSTLALSKMVKYCKKDVLLLEKAYNRVKAFCKPKILPAAIKIDRSICPRCTSGDTQKRGQTYGLNAKRKHYCKPCGHHFIGVRIS